MGDPTVTVTQWNTRPTAENPNGQFHDCLWQIAEEQATLARMQTSREDFNTAHGKITPKELQQQLDAICDKNGFQRIDGSGPGRRNPNLIHDGEQIKVSINPEVLGKPAAGIDDPLAGTAYGKAVQSDTGNGPDLVKKQDLDAWLETIPGFKTLPDPLQKSWIDAYSRKTISPYQLTALASNGTFDKLDELGKRNVLALYGRPDQGYATAEINKIVGAPVDDGNINKLRVIGTSGFGQLTDVQQQQVLGKYGEDRNFRNALDKIVQQDNFKNKSAAEQAHALSILARYTERKNGYTLPAGGKGRGGDQNTLERPKLVLEKLYNDVLANPDFKLGEGTPGKETGDQGKRIDDFAKDAHKIK